MSDPGEKFNADADIPPDVMGKIMEAALSSPGEPEEDEPEVEPWDEPEWDDAPDGHIPPAPEPEKKASVSGADLKKIERKLDDQDDTVRTISDIVCDIRTRIQKMADSPLGDMAADAIARKAGEPLEKLLTERLDEIEKRIGWMDQRVIKEIFNQLDKKILVLAERGRDAERAMERQARGMGRQIALWSVACGFGWMALLGMAIFFLK